MKIKSLIALFCCLCIVLLGGCAPIGSDNGELMRPPKTTGDEEKIIELIVKSSGNNYTLKYPENGSNRSAIIMTDLDNDSKDEAIAFYQINDTADTTTHMLIMYENDEGWNLAGNIETQNTDIDRVEFSDITGDGNLEIIAGYKTFNSSINQLNISSYKAGKSEEINVSQTYTSFVINDFDSDAKNDILTLSIHTDKQSEAMLLSYDDSEKKVQLKSTVGLDQNVTNFESIISGKINANDIGAAIDGTVAPDKLMTQVIYFNKESQALVNGLSANKAQTINLTNPTIRDGKTYSMDIDKNDIIEIPILSKMLHSDDENAEFVATSVTWNEFDTNTNTLVESLHMIVNYNSSYYFTLSKDYLENTSARINVSDNSMTISQWNGTNLENELLTIKVFDSDDWTTTGKSQGFTLIKQEGSKVYCYKIINNTSPYKFTDDDVQKSFILFSDYL